MDLKEPLTVEVYWRTPEECAIEELGIKSEHFNETKPVTFYSVDNISYYICRDEDKCCIQSGGNDFLTNRDFEDISKEIEKRR